VTFDLPIGYMSGVVFLSGFAIILIFLDVLFKIRLPKAIVFQNLNLFGTREAFIALALAWIVILFCLADITLFPIPLLSDPTLYATFDGGREHVRHISDLSWILPVVALLCVRGRFIKTLFISIAFVFPILVIDRNRLFAALFSLIFVLVFCQKRNRQLPWKKILFLLISCGLAFSILGIVRSGSLTFIQLPFTSLFVDAPPSVQWLLLYMSTGIYNFSSILNKNYINVDFLVNQLLPLKGSVATLGTGIPLDAATINVGTEFFPFLMAFGLTGVIGSMLLLFIALLWCVRNLRRRVTIFSLLIFLRIAYVCLMSPFAPQAFTFTNFGFIILCLILPLFLPLIPKKASFLDAK
jgi:hypothetical protein